MREKLHWESLGEHDSLSSIVRSMIGKFRLPVRLGELKIDSDELSICSDIAESIIMKGQNIVGADTLFEILREAY
jgi:hypothetical protein